MLIGQQASSPGYSLPARLGQEDGALFVAVSSALRRLLLQAEITAARLEVAAIEGEAGTGKHLFAQTLHQLSGLIALPFRRCDAREWLASESDASTLTGTLYLDRVDLLAASGQGLLLKFIKMVQTSAAGKPAGTRRFILLISSHTPLRQLAGRGNFLPDLAFRLTAVRFLLPPLREHREDIAPISQALIDRICRRYQQPTAVLAPGTLPRLLQHNWPGNVRELSSVLESAILESTTGILRPANLHLDPPPNTNSQNVQLDTLVPAPVHPQSLVSPPPNPDDMSLDGVIHRHIQLVLDLNRGNKLRAARQLGISRSTLYRILAGESSLAS